MQPILSSSSPGGAIRERGIGLQGSHVQARAITQQARSRQILQPLSLELHPGEFVVIAGGSGAGKTTLLRALAGLTAPTSGSIAHDGTELNPSKLDVGVGYVPQDDIIHGELPLGRTLEHAARLRLPHSTSGAEIKRIVAETLGRLDLAHRASVPVKDLSGGQRKRASIAVELLTRPKLFALDEPTSGLDPSTSAEVIRILRGLAESGMTVVITSHAPEDLMASNRLVFLARDGYLAFDGTPEQALDYFEVERLSQAYERLDRGESAERWSAKFAAWQKGRQRAATANGDDIAGVTNVRTQAPAGGTSLRQILMQWRTLTRREFELLGHNRLTLAIILGSPVLVTAMMTVLFRSGTVASGHPMEALNLAFWLAFDGFFFGLTYGLLQIVMEFPNFARERRSGISVAAYVAGKVSVLVPVLVVIDVLLLAVLRVTDRLPAEGLDVYGPLAAVFLLDALAGLAFGLFTSALVRHPAQAALALPMLCFPQVLFAGAIVPVDSMALPGRWLSFGLATRWAFEAMSRTLGVGRTESAATPGAPDYSSAIFGSSVPGSLALVLMSVLLIAATVVALRWRSKAS
jgi:ABC-type multidrug transport system ATPase subunit